MKSILVLSNGYGEDEIAASVIKEIKKTDPAIDIYALPLVGKGYVYNDLDVKKLGPTKLMPSGGLVPANHFKMLVGDIIAGLIPLTIGQIRSILKIRSKIDLALSVGDSYPVIMNSLFARKKQIFIGTAKSNYFCPYSKKEKDLFKKYCHIVFPRDAITARDLSESGVNAEYVGNVMMDSINITGFSFDVKYPEVFIGVFPGSRESVYKDFPFILEVAEAISKKVKWEIKYFAALAPSVDIGDMTASSIGLGWEIATTNCASGIVAKLSKGKITVNLTRGIFGDILQNAHIVLGQAGTANEQAVGMGKPVVAFEEETSDEKLGWYRLRQKGLLGDSLKIVVKDKNSVAEELINILENTHKYEYMSKIGKARMGLPGGAKKIAERIVEEIYV